MTEGLDTVLATAARQMDDADSSADVLEVAVGWSMSLVPGCEMAGVTLRRRRGRTGVHGAVRTRGRGVRQVAGDAR